MQIILANPRGFCAGVDRAIEIVKRVLAQLGAPIYVHHEVVHNKTVVEELKVQGAVFVEKIENIPDGATVIFSAHGVAPSVRKEAKKKKLQIFDATCPLVIKVHMEVVRYSRLAYECILIGHAGHPEIEGTLGYYNNLEGGIYLLEKQEDISYLHVKNPLKLAYVTQTTLSVDNTNQIIARLKQCYPFIVSPKKEDICYATQNRQDAVKQLISQCDVVLVVGSVNSSNSNRLKELSERLGKPAYLVDSAKDIPFKALTNKSVIGITAGASAPEFLVQQLVTSLQKWSGGQVRELMGYPENITFTLPRELQKEMGTS